MKKVIVLAMISMFSLEAFALKQFNQRTGISARAGTVKTVSGAVTAGTNVVNANPSGGSIPVFSKQVTVEGTGANKGKCYCNQENVGPTPCGGFCPH